MEALIRSDPCPLRTIFDNSLTEFFELTVPNELMNLVLLSPFSLRPFFIDSTPPNLSSKATALELTVSFEDKSIRLSVCEIIEKRSTKLK